MGLDPLHLSVLASASEDPKEKKDAGKVLALMARGKHWVLVVRPFSLRYTTCVDVEDTDAPHWQRSMFGWKAGLCHELTLL